MEKVKSFFKPLISVIMGTLMIIVSLEWFSIGDVCIVIGVFNILAGIVYLCFGIIDIFMAGKYNSLDLASYLAKAIAFPLVMFITTLILLITLVDFYGAAGWIEAIIIMIGALGLIVLILAAVFGKSEQLMKIAELCGIVFIAGLILSLIFNVDGSAVTLGDVSIYNLIIYGGYTSIFFSSVKQTK